MGAEEKFENLAERRLADAAERGEFDNLPGTGKPIHGLDRPYDPTWWVKQLMERESLAAKTRHQQDEIAGRLSAVWPLTSISAVRRRVNEMNARLEALGAQPLDVDEIVRLWKRFGIYRRR